MCQLDMRVLGMVLSFLALVDAKGRSCLPEQELERGLAKTASTDPNST
jgi:hypothetical protein